MPERYWLVHPNGGKQLIDPLSFDIARLAEQVVRLGGHLVVEECESAPAERGGHEVESEAQSLLVVGTDPIPAHAHRFEPPLSALGPLFRSRLDRIYRCGIDFRLDINPRPTVRVLGGYYHRRRLVRIYTHDRGTGRRPLEELFDTFLHEVAHHLEYTEPHAFHAHGCGRVRGRMHSRLFWRILGELKSRWAGLQSLGPEA